MNNRYRIINIDKEPDWKNFPLYTTHINGKDSLKFKLELDYTLECLDNEINFYNKNDEFILKIYCVYDELKDVLIAYLARNKIKLIEDKNPTIKKDRLGDIE